MLAVEPPQPPVGYSTLWTVLGLTVLVVGCAAVGWVLLPRRSRVLAVTGAEIPSAMTAAAGTGRTFDYSGHLDAIEAAARAGAIDQRRLHHELSHTIRHFLATTAGVPATSMTIAELTAAGHLDAANVLASFRDGQFNRTAAAGDPVAATRRLLTGRAAADLPREVA